MWTALENVRRSGSKIVLLMLLGGGVFGNDEAWIFAAIRRALAIVPDSDLDVRIVSYRPPSAKSIAFVDGLRT